MTLEECYAQLEGNYAEAKSRLMSDKLVEKFLLKFPADPTMSELTEAVDSGNIELAFRAAHTLKGVAGNLSFTKLQVAASELTEQLRPLPSAVDGELYASVAEAHKRTIAAIEAYQA